MLLIEKIDYDTKTVTYYGSNNRTLRFNLFENAKYLEEASELLSNFSLECGFSSFVHTPVISHGQAIEGGTIHRCRDLLLAANQKAFFDERRKIIKEAQSYFKILEKNDDINIKIELPINCSTRDVSLEKLSLEIKDNRTIISDCSFSSALQSKPYKSLNTKDFSHMCDSEMFDEKFRTCHLGLEHFADNWELIKSEVEKSLIKEEEIELE